MAFVLKSKNRWKPVAVDASAWGAIASQGFVCLEELTDYKIIKSRRSQLSKKDANQEQNNKKKNLEKSKRLKSQKSKKQQANSAHCNEADETVDAASSTKPSRRETQDDNDGVEKTDATLSRKRKKSKQRNQSAKVGRKEEKKGGMDKAEQQEEKEEAETVEKECTVTDMSAWKEMFVPDVVLRAMAELGFSCPTPIQAASLPSACRDRMDIVGTAQTGSGKTLAFAIPLLHHILRCKEADDQGSDIQLKEEEEEEAENTGDGTEEETISGDIIPGDIDGDEEGEEDEAFGDEMREAYGDESMGSADDASDASGDFDLPPDDDDEMEMEEMAGGTGCVKVINNVSFDWLEPAEAAPRPAKPRRPLLALVLTPTRELAIQVKNHITAVSKYTDIHTMTVVGGMSTEKQERLLKKCPEIVVATPGRLWELMQQGDPHLSTIPDIRFLVIDETDRMVESGHFEELKQLLELINEDEAKRARRQNFIFSATLTLKHSGPQRVFKKRQQTKFTPEQKMESLLTMVGVRRDAYKQCAVSCGGTAALLTETRVPCGAPADKDNAAYYVLRRHRGRTIIFANSKDCVRRLVALFDLLGCRPLPLHADMQQRQRLRNLDRFIGSETGLLIATDVAARGLDIPNVEHVIHFQVPRTTENYVHRSGRTARANKEGLSVMLVGADDQQNYRKIRHTLNKDEDLPLFPLETQYLTALKAQVNLAREIDKLQHRMIKYKKQNSWFENAAREADMELDEENLLHDLGTSRDQKEHRQRLSALKSDLKHLLAQPLLQRSFSGKYPTKTGRLCLPYMQDCAPGTAVACVAQNEKVKVKVAPPSTQTDAKSKKSRRRRDRKKNQQK